MDFYLIILIKFQLDIYKKNRLKSGIGHLILVLTLNLKFINETIKQGCPNCRTRFNELYQNPLPSQPEFLTDYHQQMDFTLQGLVPLLKPNTKEN